jgi:hypothetical protein
MADTRLSEHLAFEPWWRHGDPVPPWIRDLLDKTALQELAVSQIQLQKSILEAQVKSLDQQIAILSRKR